MSPPRSPSSPPLTRRDLIAGRLLGGLRRALAPSAPHVPAAPSGPAVALVAHILPRQCLAWRKLDCVVCLERCPVQGAIALRDGKPYVVADHCTGCGDCRAVCPAPSNAIMLLPRPGTP